MVSEQSVKKPSLLVVTKGFLSNIGNNQATNSFLLLITSCLLLLSIMLMFDTYHNYVHVPIKCMISSIIIMLLCPIGKSIAICDHVFTIKHIVEILSSSLSLLQCNQCAWNSISELWHISMQGTVNLKCNIIWFNLLCPVQS